MAVLATIRSGILFSVSIISLESFGLMELDPDLLISGQCILTQTGGQSSPCNVGSVQVTSLLVAFCLSCLSFYSGAVVLLHLITMVESFSQS